jgi:hypothetical protein
MVTSSFLGTYMQSNKKKKSTTPLWPSIFLVEYQKDDVSMTNPLVINVILVISYNQLQGESQLNPWPSDEGPRAKSGKSRLNLHGTPFWMEIQLV